MIVDIFIGKLQDQAQSNDYLNKMKEKDNYFAYFITQENMKDVIARGINFAM